MPNKADASAEIFVVSAIGAEGSTERLHADWLLEGIIEPALADELSDCRIVRADKIGTPGAIDSQIIGRLLTAKLVIADLTFHNANAFYEIGIRHVTGLPIVHVHRADQKIPFDISMFRSMPYSLDSPLSLKRAQQALLKIVKEAISPEHETINPVTQARGTLKFSETATEPDKILAAQLASVMERLSALETPPKDVGSDEADPNEAIFSVTLRKPNQAKSDDFVQSLSRFAANSGISLSSITQTSPRDFTLNFGGPVAGRVSRRLINGMLKNNIIDRSPFPEE